MGVCVNWDKCPVRLLYHKLFLCILQPVGQCQYSGIDCHIRNIVNCMRIRRLIKENAQK